MSGSLSDLLFDDHPMDECKCGCYRRQHTNGVGHCNLCAWERVVPEYHCPMFRLAHAFVDSKIPSGNSNVSDPECFCGMTRSQHTTSTVEHNFREREG